MPDELDPLSGHDLDWHDENGPDELRRAWSRLEPPEVGGPVEQLDPRTRAAVEWMRAAWTCVEAPAARPPLAPLRPARAPGRPWRRVVPLAAAAAVLLVAAAWLALQRWGPGARPSDVSAPIAVRPSEEPPPPGEGAASADRVVKVAALEGDRVELRSGPVRLILITDGGSSRPRRN